LTKLSDKIKTALDESRMLILGIQILLGFQYRSFFESAFEGLPPVSRTLLLVALALLLVSTCLVMSPGSYHRVVRDGNDATDVHDFTTKVMDVALFPFAVALALDCYVLVAKTLGERGGFIFAVLIGAAALFFWFGVGLLSRLRGWDRDAKIDTNRRKQQMQHTPLHDKVEQVLTEARVVLPGAQALLGFQFATILMDGYEKLPQISKYIHLAGLGIMGLSVILLMTPAAYHRIVERGEDTEHFHEVASALLLVAMFFLPLGICADLYVVTNKVMNSTTSGILGAVVGISFFYLLWFGYTAFQKRRLKQ
jgi:uncharacterized protein DUF6328